MSDNHETEVISGKKPGKKKFFILATLLVIIIIIVVLCHCCSPKPTPPEEVWFEEYFEHGLGDWEYLDANWVNDQGVVHNTSARVARKVYLSPYLSYKLDTPIHSNQIVVEFYVKLENIAGVVTLASLDFPTGEITVVINKDRYLGIAFGLFEPVQYSTQRLTLGKWEKVQIYVNTSESKLSLYHNDLEILNTHWPGTQPLMKIWLGSVWIAGAENYESILDCYYDAIRVGNPGLLAPQTLLDKIKVTIPGLWRKPATSPEVHQPKEELDPAKSTYS
ncbi:hypothetical protein [Desulfallas thermosapovorans]|uniref:Concanavalin A-like lectin/glucanase superfamily protein n=1 Tax=Desulfallas thermosapovorans DSM 6562 TaxID=1121431 RepID=A0A5S4ZU81_9FIRM|nr:hypothetical protein [Desulfallas thermosapovorans]TYO96468.1 hypothetical protein LX24_00935 [Desulfallas thermosapovorans DSM 6562]